MTIPPGFELSAFASTLIDLALPFVVVAGLFCAYRLIKKAGNAL